MPSGIRKCCYSNNVQQISSLQSLDWNGGMEQWNHKFATVRSIKRSHLYTALISDLKVSVAIGFTEAC